MKKFFRMDDFGAGCFRVLAFVIVTPAIIGAVWWML